MLDQTRSILPFLVVLFLSILFLTGMNFWSNPAIEETQQQRHLEMLREYFPEATEYEFEETAAKSYDLVYNADGDFIGILVTTKHEGYSDYITYRFAVDAEGVIKGINILDHRETEDIGGVIEEPEFQDQFIGISHQDPIQEELDTISGATESTEAIIVSVDQVMEVLSAEYLD